MSATTNEWELIRRCRGGSAAAFEPLVRAHQDRALAVARGLLGDGDEAADAVQDAFVKAYRSLRTLREGSEFGPWFRVILRNLCRDRLRAPARTRTGWTPESIDARRWAEAEGTAAIERADLAAVVHGALDTLSAEHREILVLKELEELSYAEIAEALRVPPGTVGSRLHHARTALRAALAARGVTREVLR